MANIGKLCNLITFQKQTKTADGAGGNTVAWSDIAVSPKMWAAVAPALGGEAENQGRLENRHDLKFTIHRRGDIDETMRIVWQGKNHNILSVAVTSEREPYLEIIAARGVAS